MYIDLNITALAERIKNGQATRIVVLAGAGISTAASMPDFRTPKTGLYDRLKPLKLPYPKAIFHISYFSHTPEPFYAIARARHLSSLRPTISHAFLGLLAKKGLLHFIFTQNIDGLEEDVGIPVDQIFQTHGNWKNQHCYQCKAEYPDDLMKRAIRLGEVPYCLIPQCKGVVKPDVIFFGQELSDEFEEKEKLVSEADLMLVMGTSLSVAPCSRLPRLVQEGVPCVLINMEQVGDIGRKNEDVCILGACDDGVRKLADALGWLQELEALWTTAVESKKDYGFEEGPSLDECIEKLMQDMKSKMISDGHRKMLENHLGNKLTGIISKKDASD